MRKKKLTNKTNIIMKTIKNKFILASAILALASCADNSYLGDQEEKTGAGGGAISFGYELPSVTRAEETGATAASTLGSQFIVWGEKNESSTDPAPAVVFKNYQVNYVTSSANSSTSNTTGWEYVGYTHSNTANTNDYQTNIQPSLSTAQTIKYWDNNASSYTFTAVSAKQDDIKTGNIKIKKTESGTTVYDKGYEIEVKANASIEKLYISDRLNIPKNSTDPTIKYGNSVKLSFRNFTSKVRFGIYEIIPGYKVKITKVYYNNTESSTNFGIDGSFIMPGNSTKYTVTYESTGTNINKVKVAADGSSSTQGYIVTVPNTSSTPQITVPILTENTYLGTDATQATFNKKEGDDAKAYTAILPNPDNNTNLTLKIEYQLISEDTGETINVSAKEVHVPAAYCKWQSNYAYTYLFKITDSELTPITFDAVTITDEIGNQETITTVTEPSITTYAKASAVTTNNEYVTGNKIYAVVEDASASPTNPTLTVGTNAKLYFVTLESGAAQTITEASVANAIAHGTHVELDKTYTVTDASNKKMIVTDTESNLLKAITTIPSSDSPTGVEITVNGAEFTPQAKYVQVTSGTTLTTGVTYYSSASGGTEFTGTEATEETYRKVSEATGAYVFAYKKSDDTWYYKVIKVVANP